MPNNYHDYKLDQKVAHCYTESHEINKNKFTSKTASSIETYNLLTPTDFPEAARNITIGNIKAPISVK